MCLFNIVVSSGFPVVTVNIYTIVICFHCKCCIIGAPWSRCAPCNRTIIIDWLASEISASEQLNWVTVDFCWTTTVLFFHRDVIAWSRAARQRNHSVCMVLTLGVVIGTSRKKREINKKNEDKVELWQRRLPAIELSSSFRRGRYTFEVRLVSLKVSHLLAALRQRVPCLPACFISRSCCRYYCPASFVSGRTGRKYQGPALPFLLLLVVAHHHIYVLISYPRD